MKRLFAVLIASSTVMALFALGATTASAATSTPKIKCFSGSPATCTINSGTNSATLDTTQGGYAGVYPANGTSKASVGSFSASFTYRCQPSNVDTVTCIAGGAPRWSIPIDST